MSHHAIFTPREPLQRTSSPEHEALRTLLANLSALDVEVRNRCARDSAQHLCSVTAQLRQLTRETLATLRAVRDDIGEATEGLLSAMELLGHADTRHVNAGRFFHLLQPFVRQIDVAESHLNDLLDFTGE